MNIGIVSRFNPLYMRDYLDDNDIPNLHSSAMAVNTIVKALVDGGQNVKVFTTCSDVRGVRVLKGRNLQVFLIPTCVFKHYPSFSHNLLLDSYYVPKRICQAIKKEMNSIDVLHAHWTYDFAIACLPLIKEIPVFVTVRDWCPTIMGMQDGFMNKVAWRIKYQMFKKIMKCSDVHLIANSKYIYDRINTSYPHKSVDIIYNPIDEKFIIDKKVNEVKDEFITIANVVDSPWKNAEKLFEAYKLYKVNHPKAHLHVVGGVNKEGPLYKKWESLGLLEGVIMHGILNHDDMMLLIDNMSCLVHPSLEESFGNILLEGMSRCVPCIGGKDSGAVPFVLGQGKYGYICDVKKPQDICVKMEGVNNAESVRAVTAEATAMLKQNYSSSAIANKHIELYKKYL